ncbi:Crp/Fnr family transcriptional regulator [Ihubacter sp. mB4P-1]|uniref:Crp/Fnr family transcriptional regulator n=1 Tax=Ihubacter sp. mB4P-1 TaxID=3242370 RepID=UPI0013794577
MKKIIKAMRESALFQGIAEQELAGLVREMAVTPVKYQKEEFLIRQGDTARGVGLVIEGRLHIVREDFLGNREILTEIPAGDIFDEVYAVLVGEPQSVAVIAATDSSVVFFPMEQILTNPCVMNNMMKVLARKNLFLTRKMAHLSRKTIREKLISYLSEERDRQGSMELELPFNRQQLADYLSVERSALSRELSRMQEAGMIRFHKNHFLLCNIMQ